MASRIKLNSSGFRQLLNSSDVRDDLTDRAERVLSEAKALAPVVTGAYAASLTVTQATTDRAVVRVGSSVPYALIIEANEGVLLNALDAGR